MSDFTANGGQAGAYDSSPNLVLIADNETGASRLRTIALGVGCRISGQGRPMDGPHLVEQAAGLDGIMVDLSSQDGPGAVRALSVASARAEADRIPLIISTSWAQLDQVVTWTHGAKTDILVDADDAELAASLAFGLNARQPLVADVATELDAIRLQRLADEVSRIAKALSSLTSHDNEVPGARMSGLSDAIQSFRSAPQPEVSAPDAREVRGMIRLRRLRDRFFERDLFADPAWDMLLDLTAARIEQAEVAVSSLCIAAAVPPTTALRWIKAMTDQGLFERCADPDDGRRIFIRLSDRAARGMYGFFDAMKRQGGLAV